MSSGLIKMDSGFCNIIELCLVKSSILGNSTLWQVLANWLTYVYKPMTKKKVVFIIILFGLCII